MMVRKPRRRRPKWPAASTSSIWSSRPMGYSTLARLRSLASSIVEAAVADAIDRAAGDRLAARAGR